MTKFKTQIALLLLFLFCMNPMTASAAYTKEYLMSTGQYQMTHEDIVDMADGYRFPAEIIHGKVDNHIPSTAQIFCTIPVLAIITKSPIIGIGLGLGLALVASVVEDHLPNRYYQCVHRVETFPTDVPTAYQGAVMRVTYEYTVYNSSDLSKENRIGEPVQGVYYGMGY